jgi:integrase
MALTELQVKHLKPKDTLYRVPDTGGLCIEVSTNGAKYWRWRFRFQGKDQMLSIGKYPTVSIAQARKARDAARELVDIGKHPLREKKIIKMRNMYNGDNSFENIAKKWMEGRSFLNAKYAKQCNDRMKQYVFPMIGMLPISEITIPDVVHVVETIAKTGTIETAKRMKQCMSQVFRFASFRGMCTHNPASDLRGLLPTPQEKHHACIPIKEVPELLQAIEARKPDLAKYAMQLLALTFVRTGELIGAKWEEIDWEREEWHIPKERMKMKRPHVVPLSRQALAVLRLLHERTGHKAFIFFSAASASWHMSNGTMLMALKRMGYHGRMTGHGFRTLASTILNEKGYAPDVIERQLAHEEQDKIRAAYNRAEYIMERKKMMQDYADLLERMQTNPGSNVFTLSRKQLGSAES